MKINDKHIEVIVRQTLGKPGPIWGATFLAGVRLDKTSFEVVKLQVGAEETPAQAMPVVQVITRASLITASSAASFQETTRVLTEAATAGKTSEPDGSEGERGSVRRSSPAGTGSVMEPSAGHRCRFGDQRTLSMGNAPQITEEAKGGGVVFPAN